MFTSAVPVLLAFALTLQPLAAALCMRNCERERSGRHLATAEHCAASAWPANAGERPDPSHSGTECQHAHAWCATGKTSPRAGTVDTRAATALLPSSYELSPLPVSERPTQSQQTSPPGWLRLVTPLRV